VERVGDEELRTYVELLRKYHGTLDLVSPRALESIDALLRDGDAYAAAIRELVPAGLVLDVGTGAGLPAVVIAARAPKRPMLWVERRQRRAAFLRSVAGACRLEAVRVIARDVRTVVPDDLSAPLVAVTAQAVAGWSSLYDWTRHLHDAQVVLVARRAAIWRQEVSIFAESVQADVEVVRADSLEGGGTLVAVRLQGGLPCR
jgi:16S rRNA G527 N7-methylase RsmG